MKLIASAMLLIDLSSFDCLACSEPSRLMGLSPEKASATLEPRGDWELLLPEGAEEAAWTDGEIGFCAGAGEELGGCSAALREDRPYGLECRLGAATYLWYLKLRSLLWELEGRRH